MDFFYQKHDTQLDFAEYGRLNFPLHMHSEIEIAILLTGESNCIIDNREYPLRAGDAVAIFPNQIHGFYGDKDVSTILLIFEPALFPAMGRSFDAIHPKDPFFQRTALEERDFIPTVRFLLDEYEKYGSVVADGCVSLILGKLLMGCKMVTEDTSAADGQVCRQILKYCTDNFREDILLEDVARHMNISKSYASHLFMKKFNMSFRSYINALRINEACTLLKISNKNCSEIAFDCGFVTVRTFNRCFQKIVGVTPRDFRRELGKIS